MNCPVCNCQLPPPEEGETGIKRWYCDCAGFRRAVVEVTPDNAETVLEAEAMNVNVKKKGLKDDRSD